MANEVILTYAMLIHQGDYTIDQVPAEFREGVERELARLGVIDNG